MRSSVLHERPVGPGDQAALYFFYYYPIGVDVPRPRFPVATIALTVLLTSIFLGSHVFGWISPTQWMGYVYRPAQSSLLTPLSACFLHGSWLHLIGNLVYLLVFGPALERAFGRFGFLLLFCGTGYLGNLFQGAMTVHLTPENAWSGVVGASGAVSGLLGLFLLRYYYARIKFIYWAFLPLQGINRTGSVYLPAIVGLLLWVMLQIIYALVQGAGVGTAYGAHLGGLLTGILLGYALGQLRRGRLEHLRAKSDRFREKGEMHAAIGSLDSYLGQAPWDQESWLELARLCVTAGEWGRAQSVYREIIHTRLADENLKGVVAIYKEARRGNHAFALPPHEMRRVAFWLEKSTQFEDAVTAYLDFARLYPDDSHREHALARAATLMVTRLGDRDGGIELLGEAIDAFPDGAWRPMLERERQRLADPMFRPGLAAG